MSLSCDCMLVNILPLFHSLSLAFPSANVALIRMPKEATLTPVSGLIMFKHQYMKLLLQRGPILCGCAVTAKLKVSTMNERNFGMEVSNVYHLHFDVPV